MSIESRGRWLGFALRRFDRATVQRRQLRPPASLARRLRVEPLEDRRMLTIYTVSSLGDSGTGSLREAIDLANANPGPDDVNFAINGTINILSQLPTIVGNLNILGPGADLLTIDAGGGATASPGDGYRIFRIESDTVLTNSIYDLTLTGGDPTDLGQRGGAIYNTERLFLSGVAINGNHAADSGGGIYNTDLLNVSLSTFAGNMAGFLGGAIYNDGGTATIFSSTFGANEALGGGAIATGSPGATMTIRDSTLVGNTAINTGGGIHNLSGSVVVDASTVSGNMAGLLGGGGIRNAGDGTMTITNSTLSGNSTTATGGGLAIDENAIAAVSRSTITANSANSAGGIFNKVVGGDSGVAHLTNSIVAANTATSDANVRGALATNANNLIDVDPRLGPLADNGGTTKTHALLPGSPALDAGPASLFDFPLSTDYADANGAGDPLVSYGGTLVDGAYNHGTNQGLDIQVPIANSNNYTLELRFKLDALSETTGYQKLIDYNGGFSEAGFYAWNNRLRYLVQNNGVSFYTGGFLSATDWNHVVIVRTPSGVTSYINGALDRTYPDFNGFHTLATFGTIGGGGTDTFLGRLFQGTNSFGFNFGGAVDQIRFYDHPLTTGDVAAVYDAVAATDQRGINFPRGVGAAFDIGAYEAQKAPTADFDFDGDADGGDFLAWQRSLGTIPAERFHGNSDDDIDVDHSDLAAWRVQFGAIGLPTAMAAVESASTVALDALYATGEFSLQPTAGESEIFRPLGRDRWLLRIAN